MFRQWTPLKSDPEIARMEQEANKLRQKIHDLREFGRQKRLNRLQALDALETRRVTLTEILRRMEKELEDTDVYKYGDILAEVFGERKIFAHRAIGLESLLCQFMHQMLAKQHQLKIIKKSAKDIQSKYKKYKLQNKNEFHSYEALAVQAEASRLSMEAIYDDIFAAQHRIFALLHQGEAGEGTITNYSKPYTNNVKSLERKPSLTVSTKHPMSRDDYEGAQTPDGEAGNESGDDYETAMDILANREEDDFGNDEKKEMAELEVRKSTRRRDQKKEIAPPRSKSEAVASNDNAAKSSSRASRRASDTSSKSARERRREIEHLRQARVVGGATSSRASSSSSAFDVFEEEEDGSGQTSARERMRELETKRQSLSSPTTTTSVDKPADKEKSSSADDRSQRSKSSIEFGPNEGEETEEERKMRERRERRKERASRKTSKQDLGFE